MSSESKNAIYFVLLFFIPTFLAYPAPKLFLLTIILKETFLLITALLKNFFILDKYESLSRNILKVIGITLIIVSIINTDKSYTFWNFMFCGLFLLYSTYKKRGYHSIFFVSYLFHQIPFIMVNGVLTDGNFDFNFYTDPVVWYNNHENLFMRLITIPI